MDVWMDKRKKERKKEGKRERSVDRVAVCGEDEQEAKGQAWAYCNRDRERKWEIEIARRKQLGRAIYILSCYCLDCVIKSHMTADTKPRRFRILTGYQPLPCESPGIP